METLKRSPPPLFVFFRPFQSLLSEAILAQAQQNGSQKANGHHHDLLVVSPVVLVPATCARYVSGGAIETQAGIMPMDLSHLSCRLEWGKTEYKITRLRGRQNYKL